MSNNYFSLIEETSKRIHPLIKRELEQFKNHPELLQTISTIPEAFAKQGTNIRTYLLKTSYQAVKNEYVTDEDWKLITPTGAAIEFLLYSMYYCNWLQDEKGGKRNKNEDKNVLTAAMIMRELATKVMQEARTKIKGKAKDKIIEISDLLSKTNLTFHEGQFIDGVLNNYNKRNELVSEEDMMKIYLERTYKINAAFMERIAEMGGILADASTKERESLKNFGEYFGMAHQMMNDIADFVPPTEKISTSTKLPSDAYSDIKLGLLTMPIIYTLWHDQNESNVRKIISALGNEKSSLEELKDITNILLENGAITYSKRYARRFKRQANKAIHDFPKKRRKELNWLLVSIDSNKYFSALKKIANQ